MRHDSLYRLGGNAALLGGILGPAGVVIGLAMVVINVTVENFTIFKIALAIGFLWLATAGFLFARLAGMKAGEQPGVAAPPTPTSPALAFPFVRRWRNKASPRRLPTTRARQLARQTRRVPPLLHA